METKFIRNLGEYETMFAAIHMITTAANRIKSEVNIFDNLETLERALDEWQRCNEFLRCRVRESTHGGYYFETVTPAEPMRQVRLLKLSRQFSRDEEDEIWRCLIELEPNIPLDAASGLAWRMTLVEFAPYSSSLFHYGVIFAWHHTISEGRGQMHSLQQLFATFEAMLSGRALPGVVGAITPSFETLYKEKYGHEPVRRMIPALTGLDKAYFLNRFRAADEDSRVPFKGEDAILDYKGQVYLSLDDLKNKLKSVNTKFEPVSIDGERYKRLVEKCKANHVKFNSCLNQIITFAFRALLKQIGADHKEKIAFMMLISNRNRFNLDEDKYSSMGFYISELDQVRCECLELDNLDEFRSRFWDVCRDETKATHELINAKHLNRVDFTAKGSDDNLYIHFISSNVGVISSSMNDQNLVQFEDRFINSKIGAAYLFFIGACSIDSKLSLSVSYSSKFISRNQIRYFVDSISEVIDLLI